MVSFWGRSNTCEVLKTVLVMRRTDLIVIMGGGNNAITLIGILDAVELVLPNGFLHQDTGAL